MHRGKVSKQTNLQLQFLRCFWGFSTQKALASRAPPQTPMGELTALPRAPVRDCELSGARGIADVFIRYYIRESELGLYS